MGNIKATFPPGATAITVNGLHQWDYGRVLEIHDATLPAIVEVHFASEGVADAEVRTCDTAGGVARVTIPDTCLEQTLPVIAWVYEVGEASGTTIKTVTLPIIARARPKPAAPVTPEMADQYTQTVAAVNALIGGVTSGTVVAAQAANAARATQADSVGTVIYTNNGSSGPLFIELAAPGVYLAEYLFADTGHAYSGSIVISSLERNALGQGLMYNRTLHGLQIDAPSEGTYYFTRVVRLCTL